MFRFAVALATSARIFDASQLSRHPELSWRSQPIRRAREFLNHYPGAFERLTSPPGEHIRWRLTRAARQKYRIHDKPVPAMTERSYHWLGLGDIWCEMTFHGGRPEDWQTEVNRQFDVICRWRGKLLLIEYQRTPITTRQWVKKWETRKAWYKEQTWQERPTILLVDTTGQQDSTVNAPKGTVHVKSIDEIHRKLV